MGVGWRKRALSVSCFLRCRPVPVPVGEKARSADSVALRMQEGGVCVPLHQEGVTVSMRT